MSLGGLGMDLHSCRRRSAAKALTTLVIAWTLLVPAGATWASAPLVTPAADRLAACKMKWRSDLAEGERGFTSYCQGRKARKLKIYAVDMGDKVRIDGSAYGKKLHLLAWFVDYYESGGGTGGVEYELHGTIAGHSVSGGQVYVDGNPGSDLVMFTYRGRYYQCSADHTYNGNPVWGQTLFSVDARRLKASEPMWGVCASVIKALAF